MLYPKFFKKTAYLRTHLSFLLLTEVYKSMYFNQDNVTNAVKLAGSTLFRQCAIGFYKEIKNQLPKEIKNELSDTLNEFEENIDKGDISNILKKKYLKACSRNLSIDCTHATTNDLLIIALMRIVKLFHKQAKRQFIEMLSIVPFDNQKKISLTQCLFS